MAQLAEWAESSLQTRGALTRQGHAVAHAGFTENAWSQPEVMGLGPCSGTISELHTPHPSPPAPLS